MKLIYGVKDKPKFGQLIVFAFQQLLGGISKAHALVFQRFTNLQRAAAAVDGGADTDNGIIADKSAFCHNSIFLSMVDEI